MCGGVCMMNVYMCVCRCMCVCECVRSKCLGMHGGREIKKG